MTTLAKILISLCLSLACCSCNMVFNGVSGEGEVITKERSIDENFDTVKVSKGIDVILNKSTDKKVIVEANKNLHDHIEIYVKANTLYITSDENIFKADEKKVVISYDKLNKVTVSSGASISSEETVVQKDLALSASSGADMRLEVRAETLASSVSSGAMIDLSGKVNNHTAKASSGADIRAKNLMSLSSQANASSGSSIRIHAKNEFSGKATSGADVIYYGEPEIVSETDNSGGNVRRH
ncbi:head GIN domain-containing protein [Aquimarina pacifica]|uniref:head GIN domain-containing protein n=1 Tax=Aquimarina pacifica TaxID=1296415 RepID=UPI0004729244|nr:head GIN domain-containing protein [Aquimarina pacifica]